MASDGTRVQGPAKPFHRPRAIPPNLNNCNSTSNNSSPNTPRSHPSFASLKADAELPDVTSEQAAATAAIKLVLFILVKYTNTCTQEKEICVKCFLIHLCMRDVKLRVILDPRLQYLLAQLETGKAPNVTDMKTTIRYAAEVLSQHSSLTTELDRCC